MIANPREAVRRLVRQDPDDPWAVRMLPRVVLALAAGYTLFVIAARSGAAFVATVALVVLGAVLWLLRRRGQLLLALGTTVLTVAFTGYFAAVGDIARGVDTQLPGQAVLGYWALAGMALLGAWMVKEHPGRRGITVGLADAVLVVASAAGMFVPEAGVPAGFLGVLAVLAVRGGIGRTLRAVWSRATANHGNSADS